MGEAKRNMASVGIGAKVLRYENNAVVVVPEKDITIGELEKIARAYMANDPVPLVPAKRFVLESYEVQLKDGSTVTDRIKAHPDARVQRVLEQLRDAPVAKVMSELMSEHTGNVRFTQVASLSHKLVRGLRDGSIVPDDLD